MSARATSNSQAELNRICASAEEPSLPPGFAEATVKLMLAAEPRPVSDCPLPAPLPRRRFGHRVVVPWFMAAICFAGAAWAMRSPAEPPAQRATYRAVAASLAAALPPTAVVARAVSALKPATTRPVEQKPTPTSRATVRRTPPLPPKKAAAQEPAPLPPLVLPRCQCRVDLVVCSCFDE